jgi:hypothetical protein
MPPPYDQNSLRLQGLEANAALCAILQGTATETGHGFFSALVQNLAQAIGTHGAWRLLSCEGRFSRFRRPVPSRRQVFRGLSLERVQG